MGRIFHLPRHEPTHVFFFTLKDVTVKEITKDVTEMNTLMSSNQSFLINIIRFISHDRRILTYEYDSIALKFVGKKI